MKTGARKTEVNCLENNVDCVTLERLQPRINRGWKTTEKGVAIVQS